MIYGNMKSDCKTFFSQKAILFLQCPPVFYFQTVFMIKIRRYQKEARANIPVKKMFG